MAWKRRFLEGFASPELDQVLRRAIIPHDFRVLLFLCSFRSRQDSGARGICGSYNPVVELGGGMARVTLAAQCRL